MKSVTPSPTPHQIVFFCLNQLVFLSLCKQIMPNVGSKGYSLGEISIFFMNQSLKLKEPTVYLELVEQVCSSSPTLLTSLMPGSLCPGELSQLINNLYQILGRCQPALHKGSAATSLPRCFTSISSPCRAGGVAQVCTALKPSWDFPKRLICSSVVG